MSRVPTQEDIDNWPGNVVEWTRQAAAESEAKAKGKRKRKPRPVIAINPGALDLGSPSARTDVTNAKRLAELHGENLRWCEPWQKWLAWDNFRWSTDQTRAIDAMAKQVADEVWREAAEVLPELDFATAKEVTSFARQTASAKGINSMLALARSESGIPILPAKLDTNPWLFNCLNGTLDLRTAVLRPHDRSDLITKLCPIAYDPEATCPHWEAMLEAILGPALSAYVQRAIGYSLTGSVREQCLFILWGTGSNGKSTFINAILDVLSKDYSMQAADGILMAKGESHPTERADLFGMRFVSSVEVEEGRRLNESLVKQLTGGDMLRARRMREDFWQFTPTHKLWMAVNHKPVIRGTDHGIWRRVKLIPFVVTIADADQDKALPKKLWAERQGILAWAVRGCLDWLNNGLGEPAEITEATAEYRSEMDVVGAFLNDCCREGSTFSTRSATVYEAYTKWCKANGEFAVNQRRFGLALSERGLERYTNNGTYYRGLEVVTEPTEPYGTF